ncbi:hypothetical protein OAW_15485 [Vibrio cyclitrophicus ZF170]|nr:hypothetical protein ACS79_03785 [Vibrio lentus]NOH19502.1 hypothetical protein [Vibrio cyclitrophicus]NOJ05943.1 hypothetical protein [Vibrio splendidus]OEE01834.1 hypothetical protein OC7_22385 [Vibrio cyclitrophicus ZF270]OEE28511.1 hypothetical protein OAW_15485 [Vibrio cyclitrophicus ZF170]OEE29453.1 hypothetical protein OAM_09405 [Vibrio cyclitrophicus ZF14]
MTAKDRDYLAEMLSLFKLMILKRLVLNRLLFNSLIFQEIDDEVTPTNPECPNDFYKNKSDVRMLVLHYGVILF